MRDSRSARFLPLLVAALAWSIRAPAHDAPQQYADLGRCTLASGQVIENCRVGYRVHGKPNADRSNIVLFPTWYNGQTRQMENLVGSGGLVDSDKYFVVTIDALGDGVSSSPSNGAPAQRALSFPKFTIGDMVDVEHRLAVSVLGAAHVHAVLGISMGGMQAFAWAARFPDYMDLVITMVGTPWLTSNDRLTWNIMRTSILNDPAYRGGRYRHEPTLPLANEIDTLFSYTPQYRARTTSLADFPAFLQQTDNQETIGANNRVWQMAAIERLDVLDGASPDELARRKLPRMLIVASRYDHTVNPGPSIEWAKRTRAQLIVLDDDCGHMAVACKGEDLAKAVAAKLGE